MLRGSSIFHQDVEGLKDNCLDYLQALRNVFVFLHFWFVIIGESSVFSQGLYKSANLLVLFLEILVKKPFWA